MSLESRNTEVTVSPAESHTHVPTDSTHNSSDDTTHEQYALILRDDDLMGGINSFQQSMNSESVALPGLELTDSDAGDSEQLISFVPTDDPGSRNGANEVSVPNRAQPVSPHRISEIITNLDSPDFRTRDRATAELEGAGAAALPQLLQAINEPPSLEVRRRAEMALNRISERMTIDQLLALRNPALRQQIITAGLTAELSPEQTQRLNSAIEGAARSGLESRLTAPTWLSNLELGWRGKQGIWTCTPSEATVSQFDRMATQEGRNQANRRLGELNQILASEHISDAERETVSRQIVEIGRVSSPATIAEGRLTSRQNLAEYLMSTGGDPNRVHLLMLEAHNLSGRMAPQGGQQGNQRDFQQEVQRRIVNLGLDQNPAFMQRLQTQAGRAGVEAIQGIRAQIEAQREADMQNLGGFKMK